MNDTLLAALLLLPFYAATLATDAVPRRIRWLPLGLLCALSLVAFWELARYDHGHGQLLFQVGTIGAPLGAIFGGASWGTRRFYGWPDLGPHPSRLGLWCLAILLGVLIGTQQREQDVAISKERGEDLRLQVAAWSAAHGGQAPASLAEAVPQAPRTRMGWLAPPPFELSADAKGAPRLGFPVSSRHALWVPLAGGEWEAARRDLPTRPSPVPPSPAPKESR